MDTHMDTDMHIYTAAPHARARVRPDDDLASGARGAPPPSGAGTAAAPVRPRRRARAGGPGRRSAPP